VGADSTSEADSNSEADATGADSGLTEGSSSTCALALSEQVAKKVALIVAKHVRLRVIAVVVAVWMRQAYLERSLGL
jgi:hypothetical protein